MTREPILSIHPEFAEAIFAGKKRVEFRRRPVAIPESGRVWIYATKPTAGVLGFIEVKQVVCDRPGDLWDRFSDVGHIGDRAFDVYFAGCDVGYALVVGRAVPLSQMLDLESIRQACPQFTPPQFYIRCAPDALMALLSPQDARPCVGKDLSDDSSPMLDPPP